MTSDPISVQHDDRFALVLKLKSKADVSTPARSAVYGKSKTGSQTHLNQSHELIDGLLLSWEELLQLLGKTLSAAVNRVNAPVLRRTQDHLVIRIFHGFPLYLAVGQLIH